MIFIYRTPTMRQSLLIYYTSMLFKAGFRFSANRPSPVQMFNFDVEDPVELLLTRYLDKPKPPAAAVFQPGPT